jgi:hypothetical protein
VNLDRITNILVGLAALVVAVRVGASFRSTPAVAKPAGIYANGFTIKDTSALGFNRAPRTLILITRSSCHYCSQSMPFYQRLAKAAHTKGVRVLGVTQEELSVNKAYLNAYGLYPDDVASGKDNSILWYRTPTLLLVSRTGVILNSWVGLLADEKQRGVLAALLGPSG